mgnify:CR=1 FL=1
MTGLFKSIKNMFLGNSKEDDAKYDPPEGEYLPELDDGFVNPLDSMPIANGSNRYTNGSNRYAPPEKLAELESMNPRPEEDMAKWFNDVDTSPSEIQPPGVDEEPPHITIHEKMYRLATQKHSPWKGGGSENFQGGSENIQ